MTWCVSTPSVEKKTEVGEASTLITNRNRPSNARFLKERSEFTGIMLHAFVIISLELE